MMLTDKCTISLIALLLGASISGLYCDSQPHRTTGEQEGSAPTAQVPEPPCHHPATGEGSAAATEAVATGTAPEVATGSGEAAPGQGEGSEPLIHISPTTPGVTIDPHDRILYLVIPDRFANGDPTNDGDGADAGQVGTFHGGDFTGLTARIPYLAELGVNTLWITPIIDQIDRPVNDGIDFYHWAFHGYWADDFQNLEPRLGTPTELATLIQAAHQSGISMLLDVVLNHAGYHSHWASDPAWVRSIETDTCIPSDPDLLTMCIFALPDFRTEDPVVASQLIEWQSAWFANFPFDGLRADTVKHVEQEVWRQFLERVRAVALTGSDPFFTLGEYWGSTPSAEEPYLAEGMFDAFFDFEFYELVEGYLNGRLRPAAFGHHLGRRNEVAMGRYVHFLNTHDTPTMVYRLEDPRAYDLALALLLTSAGIPMLYYGDELGRRGGEWPENRPDMPWSLLEQRDATPWALTRDLIALRKAHPAFTRGNLEVVTARDGLLVISRAVEGERLVLAFNRGPADETLTCAELQVPCEPLWCHRCTGEPGVSVTLQPFGAVVFYVEG